MVLLRCEGLDTLATIYVNDQVVGLANNMHRIWEFDIKPVLHVGFPYLRKAHCMFGWDWGPRLPDAGIWRNISILGVDIFAMGADYIPEDNLLPRVNPQRIRYWRKLF